MFRKLTSSIALSCLLLPAIATKAQDLGSKLPVDPKVTIGKLPNGLTYYIRPNSKPEKKAEIRLIVNAGSILETDKQQGLAHFMEHMNFNGTKNFPKNKLVDFLQSIGVEFGADLNAETNFDQTVYILPIPTDKAGNLESGFQIISDWAHNATLNPEDIESERGVVLEESRSRKGAQDRMQKKFLPELLAGSRYSNRLPIGKDDILKTFSYDEIRSFYNDWYRPNLMAVAVVGDVTVPQAEELIKKYFTGLKNPAKSPVREAYEVKAFSTQKAMVLTDAEATATNFQLVFSAQKIKPDVTLGDYRHSIIQAMFTQLLNSRFRELASSANPPFAASYGFIDKIVRGHENFNLVTIPVNDVTTSINTAIAELVKAETYGFSQSELELAKKQLLSSIDKAYNERNTTPSGQLVEEYISNFLMQEPIPGIEQEYEYFQQLVPGIKLEEVNEMAKTWLNKSSHAAYFAMITAPEAKKPELPTDAALKTMINTALNQKVTANAEKIVADKLMNNEPVTGKISSETKDAELGTTTYTLSNGVKVTVKKTDFKADEIQLTAVKKGGSNSYGIEDKANCRFIAEVIESMGYGQFTPSGLTDALAGKNVNLVPQMGNISDRLQGSSSVKDLSSLLELAHLQLTQPRADSSLFNAFIGNMKMQLQFMSGSPQFAFVDTLIKSLYSNNPLRPIQVPTIEDVNKINMGRVLEIYRNEFGNADGFHFFIVGNIDETTLKPLLEKYIASLPAKGTTPDFKDNGVRMAKGKNKLVFRKGAEQKSLVLTFNSGEMPFSENLALHADMIGQILTIQVLEDIREKMGAIYSGNVSGNFEQYPYANYSFTGQFPCGPENVEPILKEASQEIEDLKANGPGEKDLDKVKLAIIEKRKENIKTNSYWTNALEQLMVWNNSKQHFLDLENIVNSVTANDIKTSANKMLDRNNEFDAILYPAEVKEASKN